MRASSENENRDQGPWVEIDLAALIANYETLKRAAPGATMSAVVKCDAYGLGAADISRALYDKGACREFFVTYPSEGVALRAALGEKRRDATIYVFNGPEETDIAAFGEAKLTPVLNSIEQASLWAKASPNASSILHFDTGINRLGAPLEDAGPLAAMKELAPTHVMSHLACGSDPSDPKNAAQRDEFLEVAKLFPGARLSLSASAGALMDASYHFDLIRPGIALYGGSPFEKDDARIAPVASFKAPILQLRELAPGETVGYGATFCATRKTRIAVAAVGYGDGAPITGSGRAQSAVNGVVVPLAGRISMDLICLDVTGLPAAPAAGDAVELFGAGIRLFDAAEAFGVHSYELLTGLGARVDRRYVWGPGEAGSGE